MTEQIFQEIFKLKCKRLKLEKKENELLYYLWNDIKQNMQEYGIKISNNVINYAISKFGYFNVTLFLYQILKDFIENKKKKVVVDGYKKNAQLTTWYYYDIDVAFPVYLNDLEILIESVLQFGKIDVLLGENSFMIRATLPYKIGKALFSIFEKPEWKVNDYEEYSQEFGGYNSVYFTKQCTTKLPAILIEDQISSGRKRFNAYVITSTSLPY